MKTTFLMLLLSMTLVSATPVLMDAPQIMTHALKSLPHQGRLFKTADGFAYVKVPNDYILDTLKELEKDRKVEAPSCFGQGAVGAHITVIDSHEMQGKKMKLPPAGTLFSFKIVHFGFVDVTNEYGSKRIYMFFLDAPELAQIRIDNGLPPKVRDQDFHITAAIEYR